NSVRRVRLALPRRHSLTPFSARTNTSISTARSGKRKPDTSTVPLPTKQRDKEPIIQKRTSTEGNDALAQSWLHRKDAHGNSNGRDNPMDSPLIQRRVLVVEDDEQSRKQLKKLLEAELGIKVDTAEDGATALKILCERNFSLVLTDLKLPR